MGDSIQVERVATLLQTTQWAADFSLLVSLLGEPSVVDGSEWAQFDTAGGRVCLAPAGDGREGSVLMLKVADFESARQWLLDKGCDVGKQTRGAHEERMEARTPGGSNLLLYRPA
jgi:hypothetical protein